MVTRRFLISGRVQGVGFRRFTVGCAQEIGVVGWVRNLRDRRVEVLAQGTDEQIAELKLRLVHGPKSSAVEKVEENKVTRRLQSHTFEQAADGEEPWRENF